MDSTAFLGCKVWLGRGAVAVWRFVAQISSRMFRSDRMYHFADCLPQGRAARIGPGIRGGQPPMTLTA